MIIKKLDVLSLGKVMAAMYIVFGLVIGSLMSLAVLLGVDVPDQANAPAPGLASIIVLPILYGGIGFISGTVSALIYNLVAKRIGGVSIQIQEEE